MKNKVLVAAMVATLVVWGGLYVSATTLPAMDRFDVVEETETMEYGGNRAERHLELMTVVLDLSAEQVEKIRNLHAADRKSHQAISKDLRQVRQELRQMTTAGDFDEAAFRSAASKAAGMKVELMVARARSKSSIFALLTKEQKVKAQKVWDLLGSRHQGKGWHHR